MTVERDLDLAPPTMAEVSMAEAVGYPAIDCRHGSHVDGELVLKRDRLFLILDPRGDVTPPGNCGLGLFLDDTRMLSHYALRVAGGPATLLSSEVFHLYSAQIELAVSNAELGGDTWNVSNVVHIRRELLLDDRLTERVTFSNYLQHPIEFWAELSIGCDFADIFEVRGWQRAERGTFYAPQAEPGSILFRYRGRDGALVRSGISFDTPPDVLSAHRAYWRFTLEPMQPLVLSWHLLPNSLLESPEPTGPGHLPESTTIQQRRTAIEAEHDEWRTRCAHYSTDVAEFNDALEQATTDLRALYVQAGGRQAISAGIPWYSTVFGRDSIITSLQTLGLVPQIAVDTLRYLAEHQGAREDAFTEEQPGKIMHEMRRGELARAREIPHVPYYGTVDATPLWLILLHETWRWTGDDALLRALLPHAERALQWIDRYGDVDGDGLVEYAKTSPRGLVNQGWKDSWDGVPFPDGRLPVPPIALVEVQGYVYDAKTRMAALYEALAERDRAESLRRDAAALREHVVAKFWLEDEGTFALALDGTKTPLPTITTNAGHLLWSRVPDAAQASRMARRLLAPDMLSGWGVRTLSAAHPVYNPMSYHNGSVWPHDNALVALGLSLYGHTADALPILSALHEAASNLRYHRLPELYCGMTRTHDLRPVLYPVSCSPQAWASGAFFMLLQAMTGLLPDAPARTLHIRQPLLPPFIGDLIIRGLRVGGSRVALQFTRRGRRTLANLLEVEGEPLQVRIELS
jgi:glycogen debranching enzyme